MRLVTLHAMCNHLSCAINVFTAVTEWLNVTGWHYVAGITLITVTLLDQQTERPLFGSLQLESSAEGL